MIDAQTARRALRASPHADVLLDAQHNLTTTARGDAAYLLCGVTRDSGLVTECLDHDA